MATIESFVICDQHEYDYSALIPGILEIASYYSMLSHPAIVPLDIAVNYEEYTRANAKLTSNPMAHNSANVRIVDGVIVADEFCIVGDTPINPEGKMMIAESPDPIFGDLLAYSYMLMDKATPWIAIAAIQAMFLLIRIYNENQAPSTDMLTINGATPYEL